MEKYKDCPVDFKDALKLSPRAKVFVNGEKMPIAFLGEMYFIKINPIVGANAIIVDSCDKIQDCAFVPENVKVLGRKSVNFVDIISSLQQTLAA